MEWPLKLPHRLTIAHSKLTNTSTKRPISRRLLEKQSEMGAPEPLVFPILSRCLLSVCFAPENIVTPSWVSKRNQRISGLTKPVHTLVGNSPMHTRRKPFTDERRRKRPSSAILNVMSICGSSYHNCLRELRFVLLLTRSLQEIASILVFAVMHLSSIAQEFIQAPAGDPEQAARLAANG